MLLTRRSLPIATLAIIFGICANAQTTKPVHSPKKPGNLDALVEQREYPELESVLPQETLDETTRAYFEGVLANRRNELDRSISLLQPLISKLEASRPDRAAVALRSLADDYVKTFRYAEADTAYTHLLDGFTKQFTPGDRQSLKDDAATNRLLKDAPAQTVEFRSAFSLATHQSKIGTIDTDLTVNGITKSWILDTGANFSVLSESLAKQMGLKLSEGTAQTQGASGAENRLHIAIVPEIRIGDAVVHNAVALVLDDKALKIDLGTTKYQIDAILGYPVLSALGQLTFSENQVLADTGGDNSGAKIYMQQLNPLIEYRIGGRDLLLMFDTGASNTTLTAKYYRAFPGQFVGLTPHAHGVAGAGGMKKISAYKLPELKIGIGGQTAVLKDVTVSAEPLRTDFDLLLWNHRARPHRAVQKLYLGFQGHAFSRGEIAHQLSSTCSLDLC